MIKEDFTFRKFYHKSKVLYFQLSKKIHKFDHFFTFVGALKIFDKHLYQNPLYVKKY